MSALVPLTNIATVSSQLTSYHSVDRIAFSAVIVSVATKQSYVMQSVLSFQTSKSDSGDPGTFSLVLPMAATYANGTPNPAPAYAKIANPMDVVAIYALRIVSTDSQVPGAPTSVPASPILDVGATQAASIPSSWGAPGFIAPLIAAGGGSDTDSETGFSNGTCIFIGMLDEPRVKVTMGNQPQAHLLLSGHDLTKVFLVNDSALPAIIQACIAYNNETALIPIILHPASGVQMVEEALDYMVARTVPPGSPGGLQVPPELAQYGFPWRNFISTEMIDPNFEPLNGNNPPPYRIQDGTAWSNMTDLRNSPINRLFIDEFGNLIFDDSIDAWTGQSSIYTISAAEVLDYDFYMNDSELISVLSVMPALGIASGLGSATLQVLKGNQLDQQLPTANPTAMSTPTAIDPGNVQKYGMRYGQYTSFWDTTIEAAKNRWKYLVANHDSICFATVIVRGRSVYRVGTRLLLEIPAHRPEFQNATWYVSSVSHSATFGNDWTTQLNLRYPMANGTLH